MSNDTLDNDTIIRSIESIPDIVKQFIRSKVATYQPNMYDLFDEFNNHVTGLFQLLDQLVIKYNMTSHFKMLANYKQLIKHAINCKRSLVIDKYTLVTLEYAADILDGREDVFLNMTFNDTQGKLDGNEFSIIKCDNFKVLWKQLTEDERTQIHTRMISMTTTSLIFVVKTMQSQQ
ncbi:Hypothetical protein MVR_LOCUS245 [uncultured virus]|nr:Hypothetical protein MVR_LOCUS245 [uncultured virus]